MENFDRENKYIRAKERVEELKKFYASLFWYIVVNAFLAWLNYYTNGWTYMWFLWVVFGWGIGLVFQAISAFRLSPFMNKDWEERKIREFMEEEDRDGTDVKRLDRWE
ncbi:MAG: 2TM domain-containing protein [Flavobacteriaceae bacterium]|nr:2TM domain-containing protein [Flavobacteriaceae bacterium]